MQVVGQDNMRGNSWRAGLDRAIQQPYDHTAYRLIDQWSRATTEVQHRLNPIMLDQRGQASSKMETLILRVVIADHIQAFGQPIGCGCSDNNLVNTLTAQRFDQVKRTG